MTTTTYNTSEQEPSIEVILNDNQTIAKTGFYTVQFVVFNKHGLKYDCNKQLITLTVITLSDQLYFGTLNHP